MCNGRLNENHEKMFTESNIAMVWSTWRMKENAWPSTNRKFVFVVDLA